MVRNHCQSDDSTKVYSFGIGSGADRDLVTRLAKAGNGPYFFAEDGNQSKLKEIVIDALTQASFEISLKDCSIQFMN